MTNSPNEQGFVEFSEKNQVKNFTNVDFFFIKDLWNSPEIEKRVYIFKKCYEKNPLTKEIPSEPTFDFYELQSSDHWDMEGKAWWEYNAKLLELGATLAEGVNAADLVVEQPPETEEERAEREAAEAAEAEAKAQEKKQDNVEISLTSE